MALDDAYYNAPGVAFGDRMESFLVQQQAQKRQAMLDQITVQREARLAQSEQDDLEEKRQARAERLQEHLLNIHERENKDAETALQKQKDEHQKQLNDMLPGDVMSADMKANDIKYNGGQNIVNPKQGLVNFMRTMPSDSPAQAGVAAQTQGPMTFIGNRVDRVKAAQDAKIKDISDQMAKAEPGSPEFIRAATAYEMASGKSLPAGLIKVPAAPIETQAMMKQNPRGNGPPQRMVDGQWVDWTTDVPKNAHWETQAAPADPNAAGLRADTFRNQIHKQATDRIDKLEVPYAKQLDSLNKLGTSLAEKGNPQADALIATELLKSTIAGDGVRLTQPEINAVTGARTKQESFWTALNAWGGDPTKPLILNERQKDDIRKVAIALRQKVRAKTDKLSATRDSVDQASSADEINKAITALHKQLTTDSDQEFASPGGVIAPSTPADYINRARGQ